MFSGKKWEKLLRNSFLHAIFINEPNTYLKHHWVSYSIFLLQLSGNTLQWTFTINLLAFQGRTVIMVVIARSSKSAYFGTLPSNSSACKAAELFTTVVYKIHCYFEEHHFRQRSHFYEIFFGKPYSSNMEQNFR